MELSIYSNDKNMFFVNIFSILFGMKEVIMFLFVFWYFNRKIEKTQKKLEDEIKENKKIYEKQEEILSTFSDLHDVFEKLINENKKKAESDISILEKIVLEKEKLIITRIESDIDLVENQIDHNLEQYSILLNKLESKTDKKLNTIVCDLHKRFNKLIKVNADNSLIKFESIDTELSRLCFLIVRTQADNETKEKIYENKFKLIEENLSKNPLDRERILYYIKSSGFLQKFDSYFTKSNHTKNESISICIENDLFGLFKYEFEKRCFCFSQYNKTEKLISIDNFVYFLNYSLSSLKYLKYIIDFVESFRIDTIDIRYSNAQHKIIPFDEFIKNINNYDRTYKDTRWDNCNIETHEYLIEKYGISIFKK